MSEEPEQTYSARDIVLEFFPATNERLIPTRGRYQLKKNDQGSLVLYCEGSALLSFSAVTPHGDTSTRLCCDFCQRSAPRSFLSLYRVQVPGSGGRRFCYVSLCRDTDGCNLRRFDDAPIRALLAKCR